MVCGHDLPRRDAVGEAPITHLHHPAGQARRHRGVVGDHQQGRLQFRHELFHQTQGGVDGRRVEPGGRFVEHQQLGVARQGAGQRHPPPLPARQLRRETVQEVAGRRQSEDLQGLVAESLRILTRTPRQLRHQVSDAAGRGQRPGRVLIQPGDATPQSPQGLGGGQPAIGNDGHIQRRHVSRRQFQTGRDRTQQGQGQGRFPGAGFPDEADPLAPVHGKGGFVQDRSGG